MITKAAKRSQASNTLNVNAQIFLNELQSIKDDTQMRINQLNLFGIDNHHVNLPIALRESQDLLQNIHEIADNQNGAYRAQQCAISILDQWSNTSIILKDQMDETMQLKYDILNVKNRFYDLIKNAYKTTEILSNVNAIQSTNKIRFDRLAEQLQKVSHLRSNINDVYNNSIMPQTDVVFNMIDDNHEKIKQDLSNIIRLKTIVHETNQQCAQKLNNLRHEWLPVALNHSNSLMESARNYVKLFQNTKNSAEVAMLARYAFFTVFSTEKNFYLFFLQHCI